MQAAWIMNPPHERRHQYSSVYNHNHAGLFLALTFEFFSKKIGCSAVRVFLHYSARWLPADWFVAIEFVLAFLTFLCVLRSAAIGRSLFRGIRNYHIHRLLFLLDFFSYKHWEFEMLLCSNLQLQLRNLFIYPARAHIRGLF